MIAASILFVAIAFWYARKRDRIAWWWILGAGICLAAACWTQEEIAKDVGCPRTTVEEFLTETADLPKSSKPACDKFVTSGDVFSSRAWEQVSKGGNISTF